ncbi:MAG: RNA-binding S4 domain-containing protein [Oscillospiraceae bacterium]|nr:RNA-binding S4 domain-containing protein [Oscillospiraceae bacterium]
MRLDKYLKVSRLIKRRTVANEAVDGEKVTVNGRQVKPSYQVKEGDIIEITFGKRVVKVKVLSTEDNVSKNNASAMYSEVV